jgi:O-antigen/teichoic acid export membrane protein
MTQPFWKKISANTLWKGLQLFSVFLLNVGVARVFKAEGSGNVLFLLTNFQLAATVASLSIESGIQYYGAMDPSLIPGLVRFVFRYALLVTLLLSVLLPLLLAAHILSPSVSPLLFAGYAIGFIAGTTVFKFFSVIGYALRSFVFPTVLELGGNLGLLICLGVLQAFHPRWGASLFFLLFYMIPLAYGLILFLYLGKKYAPVFRSGSPAAVHFPSLFRYSGMALLNNLVFFGVYRMDYWFVHFYCDGRELGNYIQASRLGQLFFYFPQLIAMLIFTEVVQGTAFTSRKAIGQLMWLVAGIYTICIGIFLVAGRNSLVWLLGPSFGQVYPAFIRLIPGIYALGPLAILSSYFAARARLEFNLWGGLIGLGLMLTGDWLFIPRFHIMGAAIVSSVAYIGYFVYGYVAFYRLTTDA